MTILCKVGAKTVREGVAAVIDECKGFRHLEDSGWSRRSDQPAVRFLATGETATVGGRTIFCKQVARPQTDKTLRGFSSDPHVRNFGGLRVELHKFCGDHEFVKRLHDAVIKASSAVQETKMNEIKKGEFE